MTIRLLVLAGIVVLAACANAVAPKQSGTRYCNYIDVQPVDTVIDGQLTYVMHFTSYQAPCPIDTTVAK